MKHSDDWKGMSWGELKRRAKDGDLTPGQKRELDQLLAPIRVAAVHLSNILGDPFLAPIRIAALGLSNTLGNTLGDISRAIQPPAFPKLPAFPVLPPPPSITYVPPPQPPSARALQELADTNARLHQSIEDLEEKISSLQAEKAALMLQLQDHWLKDSEPYDADEHSIGGPSPN